jgi:Lrp/AsnC family transcriptional regulator, leucine-responsive regulatory protein
MLDNTDMHILKELTKNSRITMKELGEKVHLTGPATSARVAKLEDNGIIEGYTIKVNQVKMGYLVHAIIHVYTKSTNHQPYLSYIKAHEEYVINNYKVSGEKLLSSRGKFPSNEILDEFLTGLSDYVSYKLSIVINK